MVAALTELLSGAVLAGGASSRFGTDKALFEVAGSSMLETSVAALLGAGCDPVFVVGGDSETRCIPSTKYLVDIWPDEGPLGAIITAMREMSTEWLLVLSCDIPAVTSTAVTTLIDARKTDSEAVIARSDGGIEPLVALYAQALLSSLESSFEQGERSVGRALNGVRVTYVSFSNKLLHNVNRPEDLDPC